MRAELPELPSAEIELKVAQVINSPLHGRMPTHPKRAHWRGRMRDLTEAKDDPHLRIDTLARELASELTQSEISRAGVVADTLQHRLAAGKPPPAIEIGGLAYIALYHLARGRVERSRDCASQALEIGRQSGVHQWDYPLLNWLADCAVAGVFHACDKRRPRRPYALTEEDLDSALHDMPLGEGPDGDVFTSVLRDAQFVCGDVQFPEDTAGGNFEPAHCPRFSESRYGARGLMVREDARRAALFEAAALDRIWAKLGWRRSIVLERDLSARPHRRLVVDYQLTSCHIAEVYRDLGALQLLAAGAAGLIGRELAEVSGFLKPGQTVDIAPIVSTVAAGRTMDLIQVFVEERLADVIRVQNRGLQAMSKRGRLIRL